MIRQQAPRSLFLESRTWKYSMQRTGIGATLQPWKRKWATNCLARLIWSWPHTWQPDAHNPPFSSNPAACCTYPTWTLHKVRTFVCPTMMNKPLVHGWRSKRQNNPLTVCVQGPTWPPYNKKETILMWKKKRNKRIAMLIKQKCSPMLETRKSGYYCMFITPE